MQAQLNLAFVHRVAVQLHITRLNLTGLNELITERRIKSIALARTLDTWAKKMTATATKERRSIIST